MIGLGRFGGGVGVTQWLASQGADLTVTDQANADSLADSLAEIADLPLKLCLGGHNQCDLSTTDLVVVNPAVHKGKSELFREILHRGISWTTEINLFCERCPAPVVAVTGSFGKSTTCAMLTHVLESLCREKAAGFSGVHFGGNIGRSLLGDLPRIRPSDVVVLELSNAQLEDIGRIDWEPAIAAITNLAPHHLDRYENFEGYAKSKLNLVRAGSGTCPVVFGEIDPQATVWLLEAVGANRGRLRPVAAVEPPIALSVPGEHNQVNAGCVVNISRTMGLEEERVRAALGTFRGLPHRLEFVGEVRGVRYINDSKSTAPNATITAVEALASESGKLIVIVGGQDKHVPFEDSARCLGQHARVVICCGESGPVFAATVRDFGGPTCEVHQVANLAGAMEVARRIAKSGETVLFSPGAPSFDHYVNFTQRGRHFEELVKSLPDS